ncbi:MAG TPA: ComEC/Rec2 family competence protein [Acetobacteraceae bacterium]|nr:ComEC/Rec2 family competence protein [Acetobacteraceae bacterium]
MDAMVGSDGCGGGGEAAEEGTEKTLPFPSPPKPATGDGGALFSPLPVLISVSTFLSDVLAAERDNAPLWLPVFMAAGVLAYYDLRFEPPLWCGAAVAIPATLAAFRLRRTGWPLAPAMILAASAIGFAAAQLATARAPPSVDGIPTRATEVTGTVRAVEALPDGLRITLENARLGEAPALARTLRIRLRHEDPTAPGTGDTLRVRALLRPPEPPAYPGGWDLQRDAFYTGLGASGYALGPAHVLSRGTPASPLRLVQRLRETVAGRVAAAIPGAAGALAVTLLTGFQNAMPSADHDAFRAAGLAHLLAVAGLHIGIVMGFAMLLARTMLAASEHASLFWPTKQIAAIAALAAGLGYALLTGSHVPILRSFLMATLFTLAVLAGRRAISLRGLALAAAVLMLAEPEQVPGVSFQMSFSAVLALISGYDALRPWLSKLSGHSRRRRFAGYLLALALTSALAGTASAPYGAYHFGRVQVYFVIANMAAVPLTALWVLPLGVLSLPLMPFRVEWLLLRPMGWGAEAVVRIARITAAWPYATVDVPHIPAWGLAVLSLGVAWLGLWRTRLRLVGLAAIMLGLSSPALVRPPDLLVSDDARLIAVRTTAGVWLQSHSGAATFVRDSWLQYWAAGPARLLPAEGNAADGAIVCTREQCLLRPHPNAPAALLVRGAPHPDGCAAASVIVSAEPARGLCPKPWPKLVDRFTVWREGAAAVWLLRDGARVLTDRSERGDRPWVPPVPKPRSRTPRGLTPALTDPG